MECEKCEVSLKCARGYFKGCPFEVDFKEEDVLKVEVEYQVIEDFNDLPVDFMIF